MTFTRNLRPLALGSLAATVLCGVVAALGGPAGGDLAQQQPKWKIKEIPPAPVRTPEEELKTFKLPPGFRAELVAADPLVQDPIALAFDPDGRIYVVELRGYMPNADGKGEMEPLGRVSVLEDTDGDGKIDKSTAFLDKLIVPRAVGLVGEDGVLVNEPPEVYLNKVGPDGTAADKRTVLAGYASRSPNPEHMANGLVWMLDNWCYSANWPTRFRLARAADAKAGTPPAPSTQPAAKGPFVTDGTISRGQWGITQDDVGRLYYNSNSTMLQCDFVPSQYLTRNPFFPQPAGLGGRISDNSVHSSRVNPGVNRGYTNIVSDTGYLKSVTAACGPAIYRGDKLPADYQGNAFVCEPSGNLVVRHVLTQKGLAVSGKSVQHEGLDFMTSTDERFRPVNLYTAPDGTLYVVDLYRGILQHKAYLTSYLRDQIEKRDLEKGIHLGRIWRIVPDGVTPGPQPKLSKAPAAELVNGLSHPNGWWRDTCQRLLVQRPDPAAVPLLREVVAGKAAGATPLGKVHALWVLEGMGKVTDEVAAGAAKDADPRVRATAIRVAETAIRKNEAPETLAAVLELAKDPDPTVQFYVLTLGSLNVAEAQAAATSILVAHIDDAVFRAAAISNAPGREVELIEGLLGNPTFVAKSGKGGADLVNDLAECLVRGRSPERIEKLLDLIASQPAARKAWQETMLAGVAEAVAPPAKGVTRKLRLRREPPALPKLLALSDKKAADLAKKSQEAMSWPGKPGDTTPPLKPLTAEQDKRFAAGKELFGQTCATCHQPSGLGQEGVAPPLVDSEWMVGPEGRTVRIVLHGLHGPIKVGKKTYSDLEMPSFGVLTDEQIASVLTYTRREWGHEADPVEPASVTQVRKATASRGDVQWTAEELK